MQLTQEIEKYDEYQERLVEEIAETVRVKLVEAGMEGEMLENTTAHITFSIASIIDDTTQISTEDERIRPYLTFLDDSGEQLIHCGENSYTYEFVTGVMKKMFEGA